MKNKKHNNKDIIEFRYWLIDHMYGSGEKGIERKTEKELEVLEPILKKFNIQFGSKGFDLG